MTIMVVKQLLLNIVHKIHAIFIEAIKWRKLTIFEYTNKTLHTNCINQIKNEHKRSHLTGSLRDDDTLKLRYIYV